MTAGDVIAQARRQLNDADTGNYRWPDETLFKYLKHAQDQLKQMRPDVFLSESGMQAPVTVTSLETVLTVDESFEMALALHVCASALSEDGSDKTNLDQAGAYMTQFVQKLFGGVTQ